LINKDQVFRVSGVCSFPLDGSHAVSTDSDCAAGCHMQLFLNILIRISGSHEQFLMHAICYTYMAFGSNNQ